MITAAQKISTTIQRHCNLPVRHSLVLSATRRALVENFFCICNSAHAECALGQKVRIRTRACKGRTIRHVHLPACWSYTHRPNTDPDGRYQLSHLLTPRIHTVPRTGGLHHFGVWDFAIGRSIGSIEIDWNFLSEALRSRRQANMRIKISIEKIERRLHNSLF